VKEKSSNCGLSYRLDIIAAGKLISSPTTAQFLNKSNFSDTLSKIFKIFPVIIKVIVTTHFNKVLEKLDFAGVITVGC